MKTILIRNVPDEMLTAINRQAAANSQTQTEFLLGLLREYFEDTKPAVLRWLDILSLPGHPGEVDWSEVDCAECGEPVDRPHYALMSDGRLLAGARCSECASSD